MKNTVEVQEIMLNFHTKFSNYDTSLTDTLYHVQTPLPSHTISVGVYTLLHWMDAR